MAACARRCPYVTACPPPARLPSNPPYRLHLHFLPSNCTKQPPDQSLISFEFRVGLLWYFEHHRFGYHISPKAYSSPPPQPAPYLTRPQMRQHQHSRTTPPRRSPPSRTSTLKPDSRPRPLVIPGRRSDVRLLINFFNTQAFQRRVMSGRITRRPSPHLPPANLNKVRSLVVNFNRMEAFSSPVTLASSPVMQHSALNLGLRGRTWWPQTSGSVPCLRSWPRLCGSRS